jgi:lipid-binding SYLF domain-containing protein
MIRLLLAAVLGLLPLAARAQTDQQTRVDRATLTLQDLMSQANKDPRDLLTRARAVMICPRMFKAGFFFGAEGGGCVMLARAANGTWSYPAFYGIGSGSFGLQAGIQDAQSVMMILTEKGLNAVLDDQFKIGAGASVAFAAWGAGVQGSTTTAFGGDIVAFTQTRGLFGGISLEGSMMGSQTDDNAAYYGQRYSSRQIVMDMQVRGNPGADPLRELLTRYGGAGPSLAATPVASAAQPGYAPAYPPAPGQGAQFPAQQAGPYQGGAPTSLMPPNMPVQQQNLPPPSR